MILFVDHLTNVDFSYLHPQRGLLGETWLANIELDGALDQQGMVCDFGVVKKTLRDWLDLEIDHRLLVPTGAANLQLAEHGGQVDLSWSFSGGELHCNCPADAIALVEATEINPTTVAKWSREKIRQLLPDSVEQIALSLQTESIEQAFYHYSHGLKKHTGNCQRIAHGHRSRINIWRDNERANELEAEWAKRFTDIYIGTREDITATDDQSITFAYQTRQGQFELQLPNESCYLIETDSTVEWIADHIATQLSEEYPGHQYTVKAYEGLAKGAIVTR